MSPSPSPSHSADELFVHAGWVRALALQLVRDAATADDVVQDVFVAALTQKPRTDRNLEPWLRSVLRRQVIFLARGRVRRADRELEKSTFSKDESGGSLAASDDLLQRGETHQQLANAVMALRDPYRSVLLLRFFEDLTPQQIAKRNGIPAATVRSQLKRGLDELREVLEAESGQDRRAWCLALVPLAVDETSKGTLALSTVLMPLIAMQIFVKIALPLSMVVLGVFLVQSFSANAAESNEVELLAHQQDAPIRPIQSVSGSKEKALSGALEESRRSSNRREAITPIAAAEIVTSLMQGTIVDEETMKPVPDFAIDLYLKGEKFEQLTSDALGNFESRGEYAAGEYRYEVVDREGVSLDWWMVSLSGSRTYGPPQVGAFSFESGEPVVVSVERGPTYSFLLVEAPEILSGEFQGWLSGYNAFSGRDLGYTTSTPLRIVKNESGLPWVRFQPAESELSIKDGPWSLSLKSTDGLWFGEAEVEPGDGEHHAPIEVKMVSTASLAVSLSTSNEAETRKPRVKLTANAGGPELELLRGTDETEGLFSLGALVPGKYVLTVLADNARPYAEELSLVGGEAMVRDVILESRATDMYVRGELTSQSGNYHDTVTVLLRGLEGESMHNFRTEWEERDGAWFAPLLFENLPTTRYELRVHNWKDMRSWSGAPLIVEGSIDGLVLTCLDEVALRDIEFVVDVAPGEEAPNYFELVYTLGGIENGRGHKPYGKAIEIRGVPVDTSVEWCLRAKGFTSVWGDLNDLRVGAEHADIRVELVRGWAAKIRVVTPGAIEPVPLASVCILSDGVLLGTTDRNGDLELRLDEEPA